MAAPGKEADMAVKTTWKLTHFCGHPEAHDLSARRPTQRSGYTRWLASRNCTACWRSTQDRKTDTRKGIWPSAG